MTLKKTSWNCSQIKLQIHVILKLGYTIHGKKKKPLHFLNKITQNSQSLKPSSKLKTFV